MLRWLNQNKEWLFSGIGNHALFWVGGMTIAVVSSITYLFTSNFSHRISKPTELPQNEQKASNTMYKTTELVDISGTILSVLKDVEQYNYSYGGSDTLLERKDTFYIVNVLKEDGSEYSLRFDASDIRNQSVPTLRTYEHITARGKRFVGFGSSDSDQIYDAILIEDLEKR